MTGTHTHTQFWVWHGLCVVVENSLVMPGIPPEPTQAQFNQIAMAVDPNARVVSTRKLVGGISSRMDVVEFDPTPGKASPGETRKVIVRQYYERERPSDDRNSRFESATLQVLEANRIPAPELIIGEKEAGEILGRPAIVISYFDGAPDLAPVDPRGWARQLARAIARVHAIAVPGELKSMPRSWFRNVTEWMAASEPPERFAKHDLGPDMWDAMRKLWPHVDTSARHLIHTDFWPGNTLWKDGKLLAIVDWEWPALGEPTIDVAYVLSDSAYFGLDVEETFIETYEQVSGRPVQDLLFWKMMAAATAMPDPGPWAQGYADLGFGKMTADEIRRTHSNYVRNLLA